MFNSFPYESWLDAEGNLNQEITDFWTFGGANSTGTYILTVLGVAAMAIAFIGFVILENRKLRHQAATLRASGALDRPTGVVTTTTVVIERETP
jgi:hypothetical protein